MNRALPEWAVPDDLAAIVADEGLWESDRWAPIALSVLGDTVYQGRPIPLCWQIEFSPYGPAFEAANGRLAAETGATADAYAWRDRIVHTMQAHAPQFAERMHTDDTELATCVIWVDSEPAGRTLIELVWRMLDA